MFFVYLLRSKSNPQLTYIGSTKDINRRLNEHNLGLSLFTKNNIPWELEVSIAFKDEIKAINFEKYLKQGSGYAFAKKHFWSY